MTRALRFTIRRLLMLSAVALTAGAGCARAPAAQFVAQADRLHTNAMASTVIPDRDLHDYIQQIGARIIAAAHVVAPDKTDSSFFDDVEFDLVDCPIPNCFATGGKHVYVYAGLFKFCQSEEELATAMCVAYAHLVNLDVENVGIVPDPARTMRQDVWQFVIKPFNGQQENAADQLAFQIYTKAGWDGTKFEYLFQRVGDEFSAPADAPREPIAARAMAAHALSRTASLADRRPNVADRRTFSVLRRSAVALSGKANGEGELYLLALPNIVLSHELPQEQAAQERLRPPPPSEIPLEPN